MESRQKRIAKNTVFLYMRMLFLMIISLYTSRVILKQLGINDYGIYNIIGGLVTVFTFISSAMVATTQRYLSFAIGNQDDEYLRKVFNASQIIHIALALVVIILLETVGLWFFNTKMEIPDESRNSAFWVFQFTTFTTAFLILSFPYNATIIAHEKMNVFAYISILDGVGKLIIAFLISVSPINKLIFYGLMIMILQILVSLCYRVYCLRKHRETKFKISDIEGKLYKELLSFTGWNVLGNIAHVCLVQGTNLILNMFFGVAVNAAKGVALQVQNAVMSFCNNFQSAQNPQIVKSYASNERGYMLNLIFRASRFSFFLILIFSIPIGIKINYILDIWLTDIPKYTNVFVQYSLCCSLVQSLATPLFMGSMATGNIKKIMLTIAIFFWSVIPLCYFGLKLGGSPILVFQILLGLYITAHIIRISIVSRQLDFKQGLYYKSVIAPLSIVFIASLLSGLLINFIIPTNSSLSNMLSVLIIFGSTAIIIWFVGVKKNERRAIIDLVKQKIHKK